MEPLLHRSDRPMPPLPGKVLYLPDPYCWYRSPDVRPYLNDPAYEVRIDRDTEVTDAA